MSKPTVSIIIPLYNRAELVVETLDSVRAQTYPHWEAVVVDDRSTDGSAEAVRKIAAEDDRVRLLVRPESGRRGAPRCRNLGFEASVGQYVIFLDSDDLLTEEALENRVRVMQEHPELDCAVFQAEFFRGTPGDLGTYWSAFSEEDVLDRYLRREPMWQTAAPIWNREKVAEIGGWDEEAETWQDWEFHVRAVVAGARFRHFGERDLFIRRSDHDCITAGNLSPARALSICETSIKLCDVLRRAGLNSTVRESYLRAMALSRAQKLARDYRHLPTIYRIIRSLRKARMLSYVRSIEAIGLYTFETCANWIIHRYHRRRFPEERSIRRFGNESAIRQPWLDETGAEDAFVKEAADRPGSGMVMSSVKAGR